MSLTSEIERLTDLHRAGALTDEEFAKAKAALLTAPPDVSGAAAPPPTEARRAARDPDERLRDERQWAMYVHLSLLLGLVVPVAGFIVPILIWQTKKAEMPSIDAHGKVVANWILSALVYAVACAALAFVVVGIPLLVVLGVVGVVFPILGGIKANEGVVWPYPLSIPIFR